MVSRRIILGGGAVALAVGVGVAGYPLYRQMYPPAAKVGFELGEEEMVRAMEFLAKNPAIDSHAHPGRTFTQDAENLPWKLRLYAALGTFEERAIADMVAGGVAAASFSAVADFPVLNVVDGYLTSVRPFNEGEAWGFYQAQMANLKSLVDSGLVYQVLEPADVAKAQAAGKPGAIFSVEGGDFLGGDLSRVAQAHEDGVRIVTLVHFVVGGELGDVMTGEPVHNGLTGFGREAFAEMQKAGIMVDLSHASEKSAFDALEISTRPVVATHTHIISPELTHPRFISGELASAITATGGFVSAWPAGIGIGDMNEYLDRIEELVGILGEDHVALGTDMDANYKPVWENYQKMPLVVGGLLKRGMDEAVLAKIIGGNFLRVFEAVQAG